MFKRPNRRVLALIAAASLWVLIGASIAVAQGRFNDVPADHTFTNEIEWMAEEGITRGCNPAQGNTNFCPERTLTRGEMSAFLYRLVNNLDGIAGPAGPQGPAGPAGVDGASFTNVTVRTESSTTGRQVNVECNDGEVAIGGGGWAHSSASSLEGSRPRGWTEGSTPTGWGAIFTSSSGNKSAYVLCATLAP